MALTFTDDQTSQLFELLGLPADTDPADADAILAVIDDLAKQAANTGDSKDTKPSAVAAAAKRIGMEVIDSDSLAALRTEAAEGRQVKAAAAKAKIDGQVNDAIRAGKITPARRDHWVTLISADPGMADVLASVPDETAVPRTEIGHSADTADLTDAATWFR